MGRTEVNGGADRDSGVSLRVTVELFVSVAASTCLSCVPFRFCHQSLGHPVSPANSSIKESRDFAFLDQSSRSNDNLKERVAAWTERPADAGIHGFEVSR